MIELHEVLVDCVNRETKASVHSFTRYITIPESGRVIGSSYYKQYYQDYEAISWHIRKVIFAQLYSRDSMSDGNPMREIRLKCQGSQIGMDSVHMGVQTFENQQALNDFLSANPIVKENLLD